VFSAPNPDDMVAQVTNGVLSFYRLPLPAGTAGHGGLLQPLNVPLAAHSTLAASFDLGNSSAARKRITVQLYDYDQSDLFTCTFWLAPGAPMRTYRMLTHTSRAWANATLAIMAGSTGAQGGWYQLDNIRVATTTGQAADRTDCVDPTTPGPQSGSNGSAMLQNGGFAAGLAPWTVFGQITQRLTNGVFEFYRPAGAPAGVVLQATGRTVPANTRLTLSLSLGNSSSVRKRVTVTVHDADFSDFADCSFWLEPGASLKQHTVKLHTSKAWGNATVAIYPGTIDSAGWTRLDDVNLRTTPGVALVGTECIEGATVSSTPTGPGSGFGSGGLNGRRRPGDSIGQAGPRPPASPRGTFLSQTEWQAVVTSADVRILAMSTPIDLLDGGPARLQFESRLTAGQASASIEVSSDGATWTPIALVPPSDEWVDVTVDLSEFSGRVIYVRFVYDGRTSQTAGAEQWAVRNVSFESHRRQTPQFPLLRFQ
jgi:hypothetical protein